VAADDAKNPYGKAPKGESASDKSARQAKYYTAQRKTAEAKGDSATKSKIYSKLSDDQVRNVGYKEFMGKKNPELAAEAHKRADKAKGAGLTEAASVVAGGSGLARLLGRGAARAGSALATGASKLASKAGSAIEKDVRGVSAGASRALSGARKAITGSERKALPAPKTKVPVENDSALNKIQKNQAGRKIKIADSKPSSQRRADNSVRSKAGPTNREAAGLKKTKKAK
jgi:hypothetical protein